ncbi:hypothetical protein JG688_00005203, partial [Phytophthora aleatoria]
SSRLPLTTKVSQLATKSARRAASAASIPLGPGTPTWYRMPERATRPTRTRCATQARLRPERSLRGLTRRQPTGSLGCCGSSCVTSRSHSVSRGKPAGLRICLSIPSTHFTAIFRG